jgi:signal transduction histidine kinase
MFFTWFGVVAVATAAAGIFFAFFGALVFRSTKGWSRIVVGLMGFAGTGSIRGGLLGLFGLQAGAIEWIDWQFRLRGGAIVAVVLFPMASTLVNDYRTHRAQLAELTQNQERLAELTSNAQAELDARRSTMLGSVNDRLVSAILEISDAVTAVRSEADQKRLASSLLDAVETVVRPLSREVLTESLEHSRPVAGSAPAGANLKSWLIAASLTQPFQPWPVTLVWAAIGASTISALNPGLPGLVAYPLFVGSTWALLSCAHRHLTPRLAALALPARVGSVLTGYSLAAVIPAVLSWLPLADLDRPGFEALKMTLLVLDPLATMTLCIVLAMLSGLRAERERVLDLTRAVNARLQWELAVLMSQLRDERRRISRSIHSDVQAVFIACAFKLQTAIRSGSVTQELLEQLLGRLRETAEITPDRQQAPTLTQALEELESFWGEGVRISCDVGSETEEVVEADDLLRATLIEVCSEAVVNAVKHAGATRIEIGLGMAPSVLHLRVHNDGDPVPADHGTGAGLRMIRDVAVECELRSTPDGTVLTAILPIATVGPEA